MVTVLDCLLLSYHIESSFALLMYENLMFHMEKKVLH